MSIISSYDLLMRDIDELEQDDAEESLDYRIEAAFDCLTTELSKEGLVALDQKISDGKDVFAGIDDVFQRTVDYWLEFPLEDAGELSGIDIVIRAAEFFRPIWGMQ